MDLAQKVVHNPFKGTNYLICLPLRVLHARFHFRQGQGLHVQLDIGTIESLK